MKPSNIFLTACLLCVSALVWAQGDLCAQIQSQMRFCAQQYANGGDPAHRACRDNAQNQYAAYCTGRSSSGSGGYSGGSSGSGAARGMQAMGAMLGFFNTLQRRERARDEELEELRQRREVAERLREIESENQRAENAARLQREQAAIDRRRAEIERQQEADDLRRRCAVAGAFADPAKCGANEVAKEGNRPLVSPDAFTRQQREQWDSVTKQRCMEGVARHCIADEFRIALGDLSRRTRTGVGTSEARPVNYDALVLSVEDYRRIAGGEDFSTVSTERMEQSIMRGINERYEKMLREMKEGK